MGKCLNHSHLSLALEMGLLAGGVVNDSGEEGKGDSGFRQKEMWGTIHKYFPHPLKTKHAVYASWRGWKQWACWRGLCLSIDLLGSLDCLLGNRSCG